MKDKKGNTLVKEGNRIVGFVFGSKGEYMYVIGKPSQSSYISFNCKSIEDGVSKVRKARSEWRGVISQAMSNPIII